MPDMLSCIECEEWTYEFERGWSAHLMYGSREDDYPATVIYCPSCAVLQFAPGIEESDDED